MWIGLLQGLSDGSLCEAITRLNSQPQIYSAYKRTAPLRDAKAVAEICSSLRSLQVICPNAATWLDNPS